MSQDFMNLKGQLHRARRRLCSLEISLGEKIDTITALRSKIKALETENDHLRERLKNSHHEKVEP